MNAVAAEPRAWSPRRLWGITGLVFIVQLNLIFWLGSRSMPPSRTVAGAPAIQLVGNASAELLLLADPTLFALPHTNAFSGPAWLRGLPSSFQPFAWTEPERWLPLAVQPLGAAFREFIATNQATAEQAVERPEPEPSVTSWPPPPRGSRSSGVRLTGELARWRLLVTPVLPSWPNTDLVTNTVLQMVVDANGKPLTFTVLSKSGLTNADQYALEQARLARFAPPKPRGPVPADPQARLTWGQMIFEWNTVPSAESNAAPAPPVLPIPPVP